MLKPLFVDKVLSCIQPKNSVLLGEGEILNSSDCLVCLSSCHRIFIFAGCQRHQGSCIWGFSLKILKKFAF